MSDFWSILSAILTLAMTATGMFSAGFKRGYAKARRGLNLNNERTRSGRIYAPLYRLFITLHMTAVTFYRAPYLRQRLKRAVVLFREGRVVSALKTVFDKQGSGPRVGIDYGGSFPMAQIRNIIDANMGCADKKLLDLLASADRSRYEESTGLDELTSEELALLDHITEQHMMLCKKFVGRSTT